MINDRLETEKRIIMLSIVLGMMAGVGVYLVVKAVISGRLVLLAVLLPMILMAVPLVRGLIGLRRSASPGSGPGETP